MKKKLDLLKGVIELRGTPGGTELVLRHLSAMGWFARLLWWVLQRLMRPSAVGKRENRTPLSLPVVVPDDVACYCCQELERCVRLTMVDEAPARTAAEVDVSV